MQHILHSFCLIEIHFDVLVSSPLYIQLFTHTIYSTISRVFCMVRQKERKRRNFSQGYSITTESSFGKYIQQSKSLHPYWTTISIRPPRPDPSPTHTPKRYMATRSISFAVQHHTTTQSLLMKMLLRMTNSKSPTRREGTTSAPDHRGTNPTLTLNDRKRVSNHFIDIVPTKSHVIIQF